MTLQTLPASLAGFALFPCRAGTKTPVIKWKDGSTSDPATIATWLQAGNNLAIDCSKSGLIIIDVDASKVDRATAWKAYTDLCASWGIPVVQPTTQSARGGWHIPFKRPADLAATDLRGGGTLVKISDVRPLEPGEKDGEVIGFKNRGYCVAPGSYLSTPDGDLPYLAMPDAPAPVECPPALVELLKLPPIEHTQHPSTGDWNHAEVLSIIKHLRNVNHEYVTRGNQNRWKSTLAVRNTGIALSDELYEYLGYEPGEESKFYTRWERQDRGDSRNFNMQSLKLAAIKSGWSERAQRTTQQMFGSVTNTVAQIAQAAGATLPGVPMIGRGEKQVECGASILTEFLQITSGGASRPQTTDIPQLPEAMNAHGLYTLLNDSITRVFVLSEAKPFKTASIVDVLGILQNVNEDTFESVCRRLRTAGVTLPDSKIKIAAGAFSNAVERTLVQLDDWKRDHKGEIMHDNSDNVVVFLSQLSVEIRWNAWLEQMEVKGGVDADMRWSDWTYVDDNIIARLRTRANRTEIRFKPAKEFFWESLLALAQTQERTVDPVLDLIKELQEGWDGVPRLQNWLSTYCHTPDDAYHAAVGRAIIGGMVSRARHPGIKFDTMPVFFGPQGTGKSTLVSILALRPEYFTDTIMLGDASKELILALAGILCVEVSEMGMRGSANASHVKAMISRTVDSGRTAYARSVTKRPRRNIFCGTTNDDAPLSDPSGNRRFLPIRVDQPIDLDGLRANIEQIVGEAAHLEAAGSNMSIPPEVYELAAQHQEAARSVSDMEARVLEWFAETIYTKEAYVLTSDLSDLSDWMGWKNAHTLRNTVLKNLGFREIRPVIGGVRTRAWLRGDVDLTKLDKITKYEIGKTADGRARVRPVRTTAPGGSSAGLPPLPRL